ncbi:glycoside hydrolase domain-containing protein [Desertivirga brevis]|uniref:glycoside hydrolase domain-containing protein n=1 Tax=Desertivirga brevis TaxID=2810310 RepID=UPI001A973A32|nr:glycoside hydrolase domain-containing protein [Pedobacter sp. SYSU D00873]
MHLQLSTVQFVQFFKKCCYFYVILLLPFSGAAQSTSSDYPVSKVNVFLGTSGDHGQLSPAASYPFSMFSIGPVTYPNTHTGYEYLAKEFLGFTHNRFEGVGCQGSGGNILVKPFTGEFFQEQKLIKRTEEGSPGHYSVSFTNGIKASFSVSKKAGIHLYQFPKGNKGIFIDLSSVLANRFYSEEHKVERSSLSGFVEAGTTCNAGKYKLYYYLEFNKPVTWKKQDKHKYLVMLDETTRDLEMRIAFSSVSADYAKKDINYSSLSAIRNESSSEWNRELTRISVSGDKERAKLFYSLLYRALQSPYKISEMDGSYRGNDGSLQNTKSDFYNGWAIWDNYKTQLPLLSFAYAERYKDIAQSVAWLYRYGKKDYATENEPSNTVRTEHAVVVLLDALRKGYALPLQEILPSLRAEMDQLTFQSPDKALESSYDLWAFAGLLKDLKQSELSKRYYSKALEYRNYWKKDFQDLNKEDIDAMSARKMYQGTVWQYRWLVPYDVKGLKELAGGENDFIQQLDRFFDRDYYNHANEPDVQAPYLYQATQKPWKSQALIRKIAIDTMVQNYFNDNSKGIGSYIGRIYKNEAQAYLRTMDDDAGAMSSWFVLAAMGISPACVGEPVYYLHLPLFKSLEIALPGGKSLKISIRNYSKDHSYISAAYLNGISFDRNWLNHQELMKGGKLEFVSSEKPNKAWGISQQWISSIDDAALPH